MGQQFLLNPNHSWILDPSLETKSNVWSYMENVFSDEECDKIIEYGSVKYGALREKAMVGDLSQEKSVREDNFSRKSEIVMIPNNDNEVHWVFQKLCNAVNSVNQQIYQYDLRVIESIQYSTYDSSYKGFYEKHNDTRVVSDPYGIFSRKLSLSVQLSNPNDYEGGEVLLHWGGEPHVANKLRGSITFFPSFVLHEVTPVTKGRRDSLVLWCVGPEFR